MLNRNPEDYFTEVEQAAFEPANMVLGIEPSPDKMLLGRLFSYPDTHRHRIGTNYLQLPIHRPKSSVNSYNKDGAMQYTNPGDPVYAPNNFGSPKARPEGHGESHVRWSMGDLMRTPYSKHRGDDDFGQPGTLVRGVLSESEVDLLVDNLVGHIRTGVTDEVQARVIECLRSVDPISAIE